MKGLVKNQNFTFAVNQLESVRICLVSDVNVFYFILFYFLLQWSYDADNKSIESLHM